MRGWRSRRRIGIGFEGEDFFEAADETLFGVDEVCADEGVDALEGEGGADDARAEDEDVHVVVFDALVGGVSVMAHAGADAGNFVGGDADADAGAADEDAALGVAVLDGEADFFGKVGIVSRARFVSSEIETSWPAWAR